MAPTRSLVAQQQRACHEIMGLPVAETAEMTVVGTRTKALI